MSQKVAYVTGGMGGIGTAICQRLSKDGFKVIAGCGPTRDYQKWLDEQKAAGYTFYASVGNVADWQSTVDAFSKAKAEHGPIDVLVNNAGITRDRMFLKMSPEDWQAVIDTNLNSMFNVTKQVVPDMVEKGWGRIVQISSVAQAGQPAPGVGGQVVEVAAHGVDEHHLRQALQHRVAPRPALGGFARRLIDHVRHPAPGARRRQVQQPRQRSDQRVERAQVATQEAAHQHGIGIVAGRGRGGLADAVAVADRDRPRRIAVGEHPLRLQALGRQAGCARHHVRIAMRQHDDVAARQP